MMERFFIEAGLLVRDVDASVTVAPTSSRLDYMWKACALPRGGAGGER